ncbi:hypothetical protein [Rubinisphaera margarita]|uniref:hypothetical protein n=1 Tax=Rubinisphaera margarita TaxID=2909586 RepID=UPI001EE9168D|nr:hypothetical protein [Rubinisphaera margarita]MCG6157178.1 hypothetical protein [Rubinisphaera margarita]
MPNTYFITLASQNHCGVLPAVTTALGELGGNMQHASQSIVNGLFTMTIAARFPEHRTREVIRDHLLQAGRYYDMKVMIREIASEDFEETVIGQSYFLTVSGRDAPGVVRVISSMLAEQMISIESLSAVPDSPETFSMVMNVTLPPNVDFDDLVTELETFGSLNGLAISLTEEEEFYRSGAEANPALRNYARNLPDPLR